MSVASIYNKISALWNELEAVEEKLEGLESTLQQYRTIREREKITRFLLAVNESYLLFRTQILAMDLTPTLARIYQLAIQEESQCLVVPETHKDGVALAVHGGALHRGAAKRGQGDRTSGQIGRAHV